MNTVHEPGPPVTLKYHRSKNQFKKPSQMHKHPASPAGTPRSALACPGARMAAVSWPCPQPCRGKGPAVSQQQCRSSRAHPPAPQRPAPLRQRLLAQPTAPAAARPRAPAPPAPAPVPPSAPAPRLPRATPAAPHYLAPHARQPNAPAPACAPSTPACARPARPAPSPAPQPTAV